MNTEKLLQSWLLPNVEAERKQITLRLPLKDYARLRALKEVYKTRSVNDMINEILNQSLDVIVDNLPDYAGDTYIKSAYNDAYKEILESKSTLESQDGE